jgi:hypothetical protein
MKVDGLYPAVSCILLYLVSCASFKVRVCIRPPLMLDYYAQQNVLLDTYALFMHIDTYANYTKYR